MIPETIKVPEPIRFGEDFEIDVRTRRLRHGSHELKLERIPLEILVLLLDHRDEIVTRDMIVAKVWGKGVFLDTDNSIRGAIRKIRRVLKDDPEHPRFIQTVTGQGYRFIAPMSGLTEENGADLATAEVESRRGAEGTVHAKARQGSRTLGGGLVVAGAAILAVFAVTYVATRNRAVNATGRKVQSLVVLPLKNISGEPGQQYFVDGLTEELTSNLAKLGSLRVISHTSAVLLADTQKPLPEMAKELKIDAVVTGSVERSGNRIRVHTKLVRPGTDEVIWAESYNRDVDDVLRLEGEVSQAIAREVGIKLTPQGKRNGWNTNRHQIRKPVRPISEGCISSTKSDDKEGATKCLQYFQEAIAKDPGYAAAYAGLSRC